MHYRVCSPRGVSWEKSTAIVCFFSFRDIHPQHSFTLKTHSPSTLIHPQHFTKDFRALIAIYSFLAALPGREAPGCHPYIAGARSLSWSRKSDARKFWWLLISLARLWNWTIPSLPHKVRCLRDWLSSRSVDLGITFCLMYGCLFAQPFWEMWRGDIHMRNTRAW